jgi:hypothetical protein
LADPSVPSSSLEDPDSARAFLEALAQDRGTKLLPEPEYQQARELVLAELATGPRPRTFTLVTFLVVGLILFSFFLIGISMWLNQSREWILAISSGGCLLVWARMIWQYRAGLRQQATMTLQSRLDEIEELRQAQLITQYEYETIYAAILSSRLTN